MNDDQINKQPSVFIPDSLEYLASSNYNAKKKDRERQPGQRSFDSGFATRHVRSKSYSEGGRNRALSTDFSLPDYSQCNF